MADLRFIDRPPRIQPELPTGERPIPRPPEPRRDTPGRLVQIGLPLLTLAGYVLVATIGGSSRLLMIPMALSVLASFGYSLYTLRQERLQRGAEERAYAERLRELRKELHTAHELQRRFYHYNYPGPAALLQLAAAAASPTRSPAGALRLPARLYERRVADDDFAMLRLGIGTRPSTVRYTLDQNDAAPTAQLRAAQKLAADSRYVDDVPLTLALRPPPDRDDEAQQEIREAIQAPVAHAVGIAGECSGVYAFARSLLAHYATFHAPGDARLFILAEQRAPWSWAEPLPHCTGDESLRQLCFAAEAAPPADEDNLDDDGGELEQYLEGLRRILAQRKIRAQEQDESAETGDATTPFLLVVVDLLDAAANAASPLHQVASDAALAILLEEGAQLGAAVLFLVPKRSQIPGGCQALIEVERSAAAGERSSGQPPLHVRYAEAGLNSARYVGVADSFAEGEAAELARALGALTLRQSGGASLSSSVPFMDLVGCASLAELRERARRRWRSSVEPAHANWLRTRLGLMAGNKPRTMVFSARRDGVHGIVAGSTGSGKSELLIALICGLAMNYDPSALNFVLVDYKGGGAFREFAALPHCVDIITNLAGDGVTRMFTAIGAEMRRRQALNAETGTKDIVEYRRKGLHLSHAPYPFLFIIIDEFAEMIADRPEYRAELESITRVGRAQGVSLILAAQRPSGVTDQMRSNIKFRICLRVETPSESRELLRRGDAAFLPAGLPGRGYLQVGNDGIELIQVAYAGGIYRDPQWPAPPPVIWPERGGSAGIDDQPAPELYKAIIDNLATLARAEDRPCQRAPWPAALPAQLALSTPLVSSEAQIPALTTRDYLANIEAITLGQPEGPTLSLSPALTRWQRGEPGWVEPLDWSKAALRPVAGLIDDPAGARQLPLVIDLARGHALIVGAAGSGKTTLLRSALVSLAASHSPGHLHLYTLDLGGRDLALLDELPHSGAVISPEEDGFAERAEQALREIGAIVERRKELLGAAGVDDIVQYNRAHPDAPEPAIVLAVDNLRGLVEAFGQANDDVETAYTRFVALMRQARPYGVAVIATASQPGDIPGPLLSLFSERFVLRLTEAGDYRAALGASVQPLSELPGRGYTLVGRAPLAFQAALPLDIEQDADPAAANRELAQLFAQMRRHAETLGSYARPVRVDALPRAMLLRRLLAQAGRFDGAAPFLPQLAAATRAAWAASMDPDQADWLKVPIGAVAGGRTRVLELEAKKDGVHGMVAGGTGSGKSELLMTLICGLALRYDPRALNFVLVDYKGGGAFKPFEALPHCVESVTNLNRAAVQRMFTAIGAEMRRRQQLNAETGTKDIVEYRQKGLHLTHAPYPHLFIIIDEYAEMISESPEFSAELDSITRVGRAQGVNLLLASQRPVGVSDQMRANIKLRICLKVEGADTSRELLRRADAAYLPNGMPGRGYIQVGSEAIELVQVAFTGDRDPEAPPNEAGEQPKFFEVVIDLANSLLEQERPRAPWPPPLPAALTLETALAPDYLDDSAGRTSETDGAAPALSPAARAWLAGKGRWPGISWERDAMRAVIGLADDPSGARQLSLVLDLSRGHGVVFGASGWGKTTLLRSLALSLAATHSPAELHIHALDLGGRGLEALGELPHTGTLISPDEPGYEERIQQLWRELNELLDQRKRLLSAAGAATMAEYNAAQPEQAEPALLLLVDNIGELIESFGGDSRGEQANLLEQFVSLARQGRAYGLHIVVTAPRLSTLSSKLFSLFTERLSLRLAESEDYSAIVGARPPEFDELPGRGYARVGREALVFQTALIPGALDAEGRVRGEARQLRAIGVSMRAAAEALPAYRRPLRIDALPKSVLMQEIVAEQMAISREPGRFVSELAAAVAARWARNATAEHADWLRVPIGTVSGGRTRELRLEAKYDGVHGMVAGGTGSGKSELLMTLICGLALNYSPDILNFVLVDYKGGGAFKPFAQLPHCVDIVTNLNQAGVARMFTAIGAEIARRQALNADTNTKDIIDYRRQGLHLTHAPYPHLFIIIDEYAEMIDANEQFRLALDSITRVGRAQGVNLLLASQQPKGVSDQMRANIKLRLCLRVEQQETSRELLRRPDAALLPSGQPGRGYLQVGNEPIELIQVAYAGDLQPDDRPAPALWPERSPAEASGEEPPRFFDTVVALTRELYGGRSAPRPWPPFLPERISLESPFGDAHGNTPPALLPEVAAWVSGDTSRLWPGVAGRERALRPVVGLLDRPADALQEPLQLDLGRAHLAIFGDSGSGKTSFLRTLLLSLAATHSPDELHIYALDLGGRGLRSVADLPHVGAVIYGDEERFEERLQRLIDLLARTIEARQQLVSEAGASSVAEFNARDPEQAVPPILVAIDNLAELIDGYEAIVEGAIIPLARRALSAGITLLVTANVPSVMPSRLYSLFGERITFRQTNADRYMEIVGRGAVELSDTPGRGYVRRDGRPLLFQAALPVGHPASANPPPEADELRLIAAAMAAELAARGRRLPPPDPIRTLDTRVLLGDLLRQAGPAPTTASELLLGMGESLIPVSLDLRRSGLHCLIVGPPRSGKTTALTSAALALAERYSPEQAAIVFIDLQRGLVEYGGAHSLADLPHTLAAVTEPEQLPELIERLSAECPSLTASGGARALYLLVDNLEELSEELERRRELAQRLVALLRRHGRNGFHVVATTAAENTTSELRRRILAGGLGLALCSAAALNVLSVQRTPAALRGGELPPGRGFLMRAGRLSQLQVATASEPGDESGAAAAIDAWVRSALQRAEGRRAAWSAQPATAATVARQNGASLADPGTERRLRLLQRGLRWECEQGGLFAQGEEPLVAQFAKLDPAQWTDPEVVNRLLRELWPRMLSRRGLDAEFARSAIAELDDESLLMALEGELQP